MDEIPKSKFKLKGEIIQVVRGIAIYQTGASPYWYARIRDPKKKKYVVRSTNETSRVKARQLAQEISQSLIKQEPTPPKEYTFKYYANRFVASGKRMVENGERNGNYIRTSRLMLDNDNWGLIKTFGHMDIRELRTRHWIEFLNNLSKRRSDLSTSTRNMLSATFRNVMKEARQDGVIDDVPDTPRTKVKDNPRPFFRFYPLVSKEQDAYQKLLTVAEDMADIGVVVRGTTITTELRDIILFITHSFVRPITTELYALRHRDVTVAQNPKRLILTIRDGKTGYRVSNTMEASVSVYERINTRYPDADPDDYIFLPEYKNRTTAGKIIQRQFRALLKSCGVVDDPFSGGKHSIYSLRHTAICMRIILSEGKVNIFNLAKNAGTSVEQIERFYARYLPLSAEMAKNLQSFTDELKPEIKIQFEDKNGDWITVKKFDKNTNKIKTEMTAAEKKFKECRIRAIDENMNLLDLKTV